MHQILKALLPGDVVFDVGANIGDKAQVFVEHGIKVVCIEPQRSMVERLHARFMNNELVTICNFGLGAKRGTVDMRISSEAPTISTMSQHWLTGRFKDYIWDSVESVDVVLLDDLVSEYGIPRYCKIDVEGYEREVIGGLSRRCGIVSFEFTAEFIDHAFDVVGRLISLGYSRYNISFGERDSFHFETWKKYHEFIEALNTLGRSPGAWGDIYAN